MRKRNRYVALALSLLLLAGCMQKPAEPTPTPENTAQPSPTPTGEETPAPTATPDPMAGSAVRLALTWDGGAIGAAKLLSEHSELGYVMVDADGAAEALTAGTVDLAVLPAGLAAQLYHYGDGGVELLALVGYGGLSLVTRGESIFGVEDLRGKTIHAAGEGTDTEYILWTVLNAYGMSWQDVELEWHPSVEELTERVREKDVTCALLPARFAAEALASGAQTSLCFGEEWSNASILSVPYTACLVARMEWVSTHGEKLTELLTDYEASVAYLTAAENREAGVALAVELGLADESAARLALGLENGAEAVELCWVTGDDMLGEVQSYYQVLYSVAPNAIGGSIPDDAFYYFE